MFRKAGAGWPSRIQSTAASPPWQATRPSAKPAANATVDVVIPVYNAVDDLEALCRGVLAHTERHRLVLIDDASPDPPSPSTSQR